ncbi:FkbM family methyltransferase [Mycobacterium sp. THU-M104]|uniref:FkbM family methyltransferase n=1 Tax=Mycobacterium sp. THU-M104 TaxID=3410515 RepID=UPI003B9AE3C8
MLNRLVDRLRYDVVIVRPDRAEDARSDVLNKRALAHHLNRLFAQLDIDCVLDVGANRGQYRDFLRRSVGYEGWIISFEPVRRNVRIMEAAAARDPRWIVRGCALGRANGQRDINVMRSDDLSSFLTPDDSVVNQFREVNVVDRTESVEVKRLDAVLPELRASYPMRNVYLKMDTQGLDLEVIEGAGAELHGVGALQTELSVRPLYSGIPSYQDTLHTLENRGFSISTICPVSLDEAMRVIDLDCVMVNDGPRTD